jgi:tetratricopeptide (TPR) repeat protein
MNKILPAFFLLLFFLLSPAHEAPLCAQVLDIRLNREQPNYHPDFHPDSAFLQFKEAYNRALKADQPIAQGTALQQMGKLCFHMGHYAQALEYYLQANGLFRDHKREDLLAYNVTDLGILHYYNRDTAAAYQSFRQALQLFARQHNTRGMALTYGHIGFLFEKKHRYDSAHVFQMMALKEYQAVGDVDAMAKIYENLGSIYEDLEHYDSAMYYFHRAQESYNRSGEKTAHIEVLNNIGDTYRKTGRYREALQYTWMAVRSSLSINESYQLSSAYRDLAKTYNLLGKNDSAFHYLELSRKYLLDIYSTESATQIAFLQAQNDVQKKNNEIQQLQHAHRINTIVTISVVVIIVLLLSLGLLVFNRQKLKNRNERSLNEQQQRILETQNRLMDAELNTKRLEEAQLKARLLTEQLEKDKLDADLRNKVLEETLLKDQIEVKTKELSTHALHVIQKNQLLEQLRNNLEVLVQDEKRDQKKQMKQLLLLINQNFNNDSYWEEFRNTFEQVHQSFFEQLKKVRSDLSASELRLISLLKMNMNSADIATMLGISTDSLRVARYRLRKKLNLEQGGNLAAFLQNI